jgi:Tfp pilus assembly protein PilO
VDKNKLWIIGAVIVMAVIAAGGWTLGVQPQLAISASADAQRVTVQAANAASAETLAKLESDYKSLPTLKSQLASLSQSVPTGTEIPAFVDELNALAATDSVTVDGMTVSDAQPYVAVTPPTATAATSATSSTATPSPSPTPTPAPTAAAPAPTAGVPPVTSPLITPANFVSIPVQVTISGSYANVLDFVHGLQTSSRLFLITTLATSASSTTPGLVDGKIGGFVYVLIPAASATTPAAG